MSEQWLDVVADATDVLTHDGSHISYNNDVLHLLVGPGKDRTFTSAFLKSIGRPDVFSKDLTWCDSINIIDIGCVTMQVASWYGCHHTLTANHIEYQLATGVMDKPWFCIVDDCLLIRSEDGDRVAILKGCDL